MNLGLSMFSETKFWISYFFSWESTHICVIAVATQVCCDILKCQLGAGNSK